MNKKSFSVVIITIFVLAAIISIFYEHKVNNKDENLNNKEIKTTTVTGTKEKKKEEKIMDGISINFHASIRIEKVGKVFYFDPYKIEDSKNDADYIFVTHSHYDHYSEEDIKKVMNDKTKFVVTSDLEENIKGLGVSSDNITVVFPEKKYKVDDISFSTVSSYNIEKTYHKKSYNWVGYVVTIDNNKYYVVGDSDVTDELKNTECDVIFIPVGGTYTMNAKEAADVVNNMNVKYAVPIHYGVVGSKSDAESFVSSLNDNIKGIILK